jgi:signal transduction histidine kinase
VGLTPRLAREVSSDLAVRLVRAGALYGLGNVIAAPKGGVLDFAQAVPTAYGRRILVSGFHPALLNGFLQADLRKVPGVHGAANYVIDGAGNVLATTAPKSVPGGRFDGPFPRGAQPNFTSDTGGRYFDEVKLAGSRWRIVLASPDGALYASVSGFSKWLPWIIFVAFAIISVFAFYLVWRVFTASEETRSANQRLGLVNRELEQSNALLADRAAELARSNEELEQFASIASHDLQEPLRKVRTFTEQLARTESDALSEKGHDYVRRANLAAERMQTLIEDLLRFSRVSTHGNPQAPVDLEEVVSDALDDLASAVEEAGAQVHVGRLPTILAEPLQMRQLLQNLLSNALKFHDPARVPEVFVDSEIVGDELRLIVRDNGIGFEPRYAGRIFRVFERLHGRADYPGTGIGLALCRKIAERHGGSIVAEGTPGVGAAFTVSLPLHRASSVGPGTPADPGGLPARAAQPLEKAHA